MAAGLVVALALSGAGFLAGRSSVPAVEPEVAAPAPPVDPAPPPPLPIILDRPALLGMMNHAADAFASGIPIEEAVDERAGRRFDLVIPFGCGVAGATETTGPMRWSFDPKTRTLRVTVDPIVWSDGDWSTEAASNAEPTLRGFWIEKPWSSATSCVPPVRRLDAEALETEAEGDAGGDENAVVPTPTVAIGRSILSAKSAGSRPYEVVRRANEADFDPELGFRLRVTGRLQAAPDGNLIRCIQDDRNLPPRCLLTAAFSEVRLENAKNGSILGSWPIEEDVRSRDTATATSGAAAP